MRLVLATLIVSPICIGTMVAVHELKGDANASVMPHRLDRSFATSAEWISDFDLYRDEDYDFSMAVPAGWTPIVATAERVSSHDEGYAIGFEAPRDDAPDRFADYVMIEILPGDRSGRFQTDGSQAQPVSIDGLQGVRERLAIDRHDMGDALLDLVVIQAEVRGLGFSVGFYAIGEPARRAMLENAFDLIIQTFEMDRPPFRIS